MVLVLKEKVELSVRIKVKTENWIIVSQLYKAFKQVVYFLLKCYETNYFNRSINRSHTPKALAIIENFVIQKSGALRRCLLFEFVL